MARLVIHLRMSPAEYYALTVEEHEALVSEWNRINNQKG